MAGTPQYIGGGPDLPKLPMACHGHNPEKFPRNCINGLRLKIF